MGKMRTNRPIPTSVRVWEREVQGLRRYLKKLKAYTGDNGQAWVAAQRRYTRRRLLDLYDHAPQGYEAWRTF